LQTPRMVRPTEVSPTRKAKTTVNDHKPDQAMRWATVIAMSDHGSELPLVETIASRKLFDTTRLVRHQENDRVGWTTMLMSGVRDNRKEQDCPKCTTRIENMMIHIIAILSHSSG